MNPTNGATTIKKGEKLLEVHDLKMHFPITDRKSVV